MYTPSKPKRTWRTWAGLLVILMVISTAGRMYGDYAVKPAAATKVTEAQHAPSAAPTASTKVTAVITRQDGEGVTAAQMDERFADRLSQYLASQTSEKTGVPYTAEASYISVSGKRLLQVRLLTRGVSPMAQLISLEGAEMVRVTCASDVLGTVHLDSAPCAAKIKEAFNVDVAAGIDAPDQPAPSPSASAPLSQSSAFETRSLPGGVSIAVPKDWHWMGAADASSLNTGSEALADSVGIEARQGKNTVLLAGNAFNDEKQSVVTMRVSVRSSADMSQADLREGSKEPAASTNEILRQGAETTAVAMRKVAGMSYYLVIDASLDQNASLICIKTSFEYDQGRGAMISDSWVCPLGNRTVKLSTSYQKSRANLFSATVAHMWRSLTVTG